MTKISDSSQEPVEPMSGSDTAFLSVIIPSCSNRKSFKDWVPNQTHLSRKALVERAVSSIFSVIEGLDHKITVEVLVGDDELDERIKTHLQTIFPDWIAKKILRVIECEPRTGDPGRVKNITASKATGVFLTFLDPHDRWLQSFSDLLEPGSIKEDLLFCSTENLENENDWVRSLLLNNTLLPSSIVIRRSLFEKLKGFPEGYGGLPFPRKPPGVDEYELLLTAILATATQKRKKKIGLVPPSVQVETPIEPYRKHVKGFISTAYLMTKLPRHYWPYVGKRFVNLLRSIN